MSDDPLLLSITRWGDGDKHALLLHGLFSNAAGWWRFAPDLASLGFTVTAPDLRGHGHSPKADSYVLENFASDLFPIRESWDLVLGHSLGGGVALTAATDRPGWTDLLVLEDADLELGDREVAREWLLSSYEGEMSVERLQREQPRWAYEDCVAKAEAIDLSEPAVANGFLDHNSEFDLYPVLETIDVPTLLIGADLDPIVSPERGRAAAANNPAVSYIRIEGSGHSIHRDSYQPFRESVHRFILEA